MNYDFKKTVGWIYEFTHKREREGVKEMQEKKEVEAWERRVSIMFCLDKWVPLFSTYLQQYLKTKY